MVDLSNDGSVLLDCRCKGYLAWESHKYSPEIRLESEIRQHRQAYLRWKEYQETKLNESINFYNPIFDNLQDCTGLPKRQFLTRLLLEKYEQMTYRKKDGPFVCIDELIEESRRNANLSTCNLSKAMTTICGLLIDSSLSQSVFQKYGSNDELYTFLKSCLGHQHPKISQAALYTITHIIHYLPQLLKCYDKDILCLLVKFLDGCYKSRSEYFLERYNARTDYDIQPFNAKCQTTFSFKTYKHNGKGPFLVEIGYATYCLSFLVNTYRSPHLVHEFVVAIIAIGHIPQNLCLKMLRSTLSMFKKSELDSFPYFSSVVRNELAKITGPKEYLEPTINHPLVRECLQILDDLNTLKGHVMFVSPTGSLSYETTDTLGLRLKRQKSLRPFTSRSESTLSTASQVHSKRSTGLPSKKSLVLRDMSDSMTLRSVPEIKMKS